MDTSTLINIAVAIAVVVYVIYQRMSWKPLENVEIWGGPLTLVAIGVIQMRHLDTSISVTDIVFLGAGLLVSLLGGAAMGAMTQLQRRGDKIYQRIGALGLAVWVGLLLVRGVLGVIGHFAGATLTSGGGTILLSLGANLMAMTLVLSARLGGAKIPGGSPQQR
ncbi:hypothetical protein ACFWIW_25540 [Amycolatopsis sp. NPDC058340]|uniref:hypothetical protein n=1 Tax=Amycolatopsis sp. NPDC058340 TaxID=3346453 RepID=UPI0036483E97